MIYLFNDGYEIDLQRYELRYAGKRVKLEAGLGALEEALVAADQHAEHFCEAELQRLKSVGAGLACQPRSPTPPQPPRVRCWCGSTQRSRQAH
jgi:hypothetical protein